MNKKIEELIEYWTDYMNTAKEQKDSGVEMSAITKVKLSQQFLHARDFVKELKQLKSLLEQEREKADQREKEAFEAGMKNGYKLDGLPTYAKIIKAYEDYKAKKDANNT